MFDLSIIIVSFNVREKLRENLQTLFGSANDLNMEVFVVDNNSQDDTAGMVAREFPQVRLIANQENLGFAKANNQALKLSDGEFVLLLNPDMRVRDNALADMLAWMRANPNAGVAGCKLVGEDGSLIRHVRRFPRLSDQAAIILKLPHFFPNILDKYIRVDFDYNAPARVDSVRGGFFMIRRETMDKVGLLDERYFLWFEEVDYCRRVYEAGHEVWYTPSAECVDYVGQSFKQVGGLRKQKYFRDSMLAYFRKWHPAWQHRLLAAIWPLGLAQIWLAAKLKIKSEVRT